MLYKFFLSVVIDVFFTSADPYLFGSRKRRKAKEKLARKFEERADDVQGEIDALKLENPFESAAAKSAMATSARKARQAQQKYANMMGNKASPEAMIAAQKATQDAVSGTAGDIAVGAEAMKKQEISQLRGERSAMLAQSSALEQAAINERGSGWRDFYGTFFNPLVGGVKGGMSASQ